MNPRRDSRLRRCSNEVDPQRGVVRFAAAGVLASVVLGACGSGSAHPASTNTASTMPAATATTTAAHTLQGTFQISGVTVVVRIAGSDCEGSDGFSDINSGTQVIVKDASGTIVGTSALGTGTEVPPPDSSSHACSFSFSVSSLPDASFYSVEVGHRGAQTFSKSQLEAMNWTVGFSLKG
jgi:hypothetical protein